MIILKSQPTNQPNHPDHDNYPDHQYGQAACFMIILIIVDHPNHPDHDNYNDYDEHHDYDQPNQYYPDDDCLP